VTKPRVLILSFSDIAADARVLKQVKHFAEHYAVTTCGYGVQPDPRVTHVSIPDELTIDKRRREDLIFRRYKKMYWSMPAIAYAGQALRAEPAFDAVIANDIDAVGLALSLKPTAGVHADIHEYAPRVYEEVPIWRIFVAPYVRWMCRKFLPRAASMTTVGSGLASEYQRVFGLHADVVTNAAPYAELSATPVSSPIRIAHSGASLRNRRLELLIQAVSDTTTDVTLDLYLMGNDPGYLVELAAMAEKTSRVTIKEPVPYRDLIQTLNEYDLGIHVIAPTNFNNTWSLPNKFFDYVQARLGLIIGPSPEMKGILEAHHLGVTADGFSAADITRALDGLTPSQVAEWKSNSETAALSLSSESQVRIWDEAVTTLLANAPAPS
jgi:hypothetical protein